MAFGVSALGSNLASVAVKMFSHLIYFIYIYIYIYIQKVYKYCTVNAICKDKAAIQCITIQHKINFIPVKFD
jgi:hypothetical protein